MNETYQAYDARWMRMTKRDKVAEMLHRRGGATTKQIEDSTGALNVSSEISRARIKFGCVILPWSSPRECINKDCGYRQRFGLPVSMPVAPGRELDFYGHVATLIERVGSDAVDRAACHGREAVTRFAGYVRSLGKRDAA